MVARKFVVSHGNEEFPIDYDTDDGLEVLKFQIFSLTSVPPEEQRILIGDENIVVDGSFDLGAISEKLRLMSILEEAGKADQESPAGNQEMTDEDLARMLQAEEEALFFQAYRAGGDRREFEQRVRPYIAQVLMYEDPVRQEAARKIVPTDELEEKALVSLAKEGNFKPTKDEKDQAFLLQLLFWFKRSFRWVNSPPCDNCGSETSSVGMGAPLPSEIEFGGNRVELYRCSRCMSTTRFPRYNDPMKLVETRRGRCGEWANCFTLYCRAFNYESRLILDFDDHVWTECFSHFLGRWMHLDPCEGVYDNPLLYEKGWNKRLNYVIAIAKDGVHDVTKRYTLKWHEVLSRRNITTEDVASAVLSSITEERRRGYSSETLNMLGNRDRKEAEELDRSVRLLGYTSISLPGRQSGAVEWRSARSELGCNGIDFLSCSSCPTRICADSHVSCIYSSLALLLSYVTDNGFSKAESLQTMEMLKTLLVNLKSSSFRLRRSCLNSNASEKTMSCIDGFLSAISLKREMENDGEMCVSLAGDPVQTSLALPVALDAVNEIIEILSSTLLFSKEVLQFPRANRLCSGSVLASGEELPFGIATSAFDGTRQFKWEEPNGAKGCWLVYKVADDQMYDLESYELMSANDAPERDPMSWIIEGSEDGGLSWYALDERKSQMFESRFQRKMFTVESRRVSNAFRFRFLTVRDSTSQSRFQVGSIDLYTKAS